MTNKALKLMDMDNILWNKLNVSSGSDFMNEDGSMNELFNTYCEKLSNLLSINKITSVSNKIYLELEDKNYHTLNRALKKLNMIK